MNKLLLAALLCTLAFGIVVLLKTDREPGSDQEIAAYSFLDDVRIVQKRGGVTSWILTAAKAEFPEGEDTAELHSIQLSIPENALALRTERGKYDFSANTFAALAPVEARGEDYLIRSDALDFDISTGEIRTDGRVRLEGKGFSLEGEGMQAGREQKVRIYKNVEALFHH